MHNTYIFFAISAHEKGKLNHPVKAFSDAFGILWYMSFQLFIYYARWNPRADIIRGLIYDGDLNDPAETFVSFEYILPIV